MKIAFVILHYIVAGDTIECIESILNNIKYKDIDIVIVDNASPNGSYNILIEKFSGLSNIHILRNEENLGFAKGNNTGFFYAKHELNSDFIILINNDTLVNQPDFCDVILEKYRLNNFYVLGPDIETAAGTHQNPCNETNWTISKLRTFRFKSRIRIALLRTSATGRLDHFLRKIKYMLKKPETTPLRAEGDIKNTILHGACLIFSPLYIKKFEGLYDKTFLFMEEDILKLFADHYGFLMMYTNDLRIFHKEDAASDAQYPNAADKERMKLRMQIKSSVVYEKLKRELNRNGM